MRIGSYEVEVLNDRFFALDGGSMFGIVPRVHWSKHHVPDEHGRIKLAARCILARHDDSRVVLVEAGMGERWVGRLRESYAVESGGGLLDQLSARGIAREQVTDVIVTHLHFDHAGGLVRPGAEKKHEPTFPEARIHLQREHLGWALSPSRRDNASFRKADFAPLVAWGLIQEHDGPGEILPGIEVRISHGHTTAMQLPLFRGDEATLLFASDLIPTTTHVQLPWTMAYDNAPLTTVEEKESLLREASDGSWLVVTSHDPTVEAFTVRAGRTKMDIESVRV